MPTAGLVAIFAHPDDETFGVGGTMATYAARGVPVTMVCATRGEVGQISPGTDATPETLGQHREQELRDAMAILGVGDVRFLDFRDSGMLGTPENADPRNLKNANAESVVTPLVAVIRERRPDVVVTWDLSGGYGHPDHVAVHHHATAAFHAAADASQYAGTGEAWATPALFYVSIPIEEWGKLVEEMRKFGLSEPGLDDGTVEMMKLPRLTPNCIIDVGAVFEAKERALMAHRTQINDVEPMMRLPEKFRRDFFGREHFYRAQPPLPAGVMLEDFLGS